MAVVQQFFEFPDFVERYMKKIYISALQTLYMLACAAFAGGSSAATAGSIAFNAEGRTYPGTYFTTDKRISVDIDGLTYKGYYAPNAEDSGGASSGVETGKWGRAFLFASSAQVLRCQLDAGFPKVNGQCQGTDGRSFKLKIGALNKTSSAPKRAVNK